MRTYAVYLGSKIVLAILVAIILARIAPGRAVAVVTFGPHSGISDALPCSLTARGVTASWRRSVPIGNLCVRSERRHVQFASVRMEKLRHRRQHVLVLAHRGPIRHALAKRRMVHT